MKETNTELRTVFNLNTISNIPIRLPPLAEQRRIVARLEELLGVCEENNQEVFR